MLRLAADTRRPPLPSLPSLPSLRAAGRAFTPPIAIGWTSLNPAGLRACQHALGLAQTPLARHWRRLPPSDGFHCGVQVEQRLSSQASQSLPIPLARDAPSIIEQRRLARPRRVLPLALARARTSRSARKEGLVGGALLVRDVRVEILSSQKACVSEAVGRRTWGKRGAPSSSRGP